MKYPWLDRIFGLYAEEALLSPANRSGRRGFLSAFDYFLSRITHIRPRVCGLHFLDSTAMTYQSLERRLGFACILLMCGVFFLTPAFELLSQPERRIVPRHEYALQLPEIGRMVGLESDGRFGDQIYPLGPVDIRDTLCDWAVSRVRKDTTVEGQYPRELLIYRGISGALPSIEERERIGPTEIGSETRFMASADWDQDGQIDICTAVKVLGDPTADSAINTRLSRLVIWWGQPDGRFTIEDTTRLSIEMDGWLHPDEGFAQDLDFDMVPDLMLSDVKGWVDGEVFQGAPVQVWKGERGKRWGRDLSATSVWDWWSVPRESSLSVFHRTQWVDQDSDGYLDFVWYTDGRGGGVHGTISIIYGTPEHILDTANILTLSLDSAWGKYALFADITGDKVPELLVNTGGQEAIKAYVGFPGQRLLEQYGLGNEPGRPGEDIWWGKPWATIPLPGQLHDGWASSGWSPIYDWGDGGLDGIGDVWVFSVPDFICYNGGQRFDSIYDGWIRRPGNSGGTVENLGDIDGSGKQTIAVQYGFGGTTQPLSVAYFQPTPDLPTTGKYRYLPPGTEKPETNVAIEAESTEAESSLGLLIRPNPASGEVVITWKARQGKAVISVTDQLGQVAHRTHVDAATGELIWDASHTFGGSYWVTLNIDGEQQTEKMQIQRL